VVTRLIVPRFWLEQYSEDEIRAACLRLFGPAVEIVFHEPMPKIEFHQESSDEEGTRH
jgi:hypothetical protein